MQQKYFSQLDLVDFMEQEIILDIDGTLVADGTDEAGEEIVAAVDRLGVGRNIHLCSNKKNPTRDAKLADLFGVDYINTKYRKPHPRVLNGLGIIGSKILIIGDKFLTDEVFSKLVGGRFIKVKRLTSKKDSWKTKLIYFIDDRAYYFYLLLKLIRPKHWIKNFLVFAPLFFAKEIFNWQKIEAVAWAWLGFSLVASSIYIINDIFDKNRDAAHPIKKSRPLAAGQISTISALFLAVSLLVIGLYSGYLTGNGMVWKFLLFYAGLNALYSLYLKRVPVLDVIIIACCYLLRVAVGGLASATHLSGWIILCVFFGALFLVVGKRRAELTHESRREVLNFYNSDFLDKLLIISASLILVTYGIYTVLIPTSSWVVYSNIFVAWGILRYCLLVGNNQGTEYPEKALFKDKSLLLSVIGWSIFMFFVFYQQ